MLEKPPNRVPLYKRFHVPMAVVESRLIRRKDTDPFGTPRLSAKKKEMLGRTAGSSGKETLAFIGETMERDLSKYHMPHAFLGMLNAYEWFQMIASHEVRHTKTDEGRLQDSLSKSSSNFAKNRNIFTTLNYFPTVRTCPCGAFENIEKAGFMRFLRESTSLTVFPLQNGTTIAGEKDAARTMLAASKLVEMDLRSRAMVTVKSSQKIFHRF